MHDHFRAIRLPNLTHLEVCNWAYLIFHEYELRLWRTQTGWRRLHTLALDVEAYEAIVGSTPRLERLELNVLSINDLEFLEARIAARSSRPGFRHPNLIEFRLESHIHRMTMSHMRMDRIFSMDLFQHMPDLRTLSTGVKLTKMTPFGSNIRMVLNTPTPEDIDELRNYCPRIQDLSIDVSVDRGVLFWSVLTSVTWFEELQHLTLWIHSVYSDVAYWMAEGKCEQCFKMIIGLRRSLRLQPIVVKFRLARMCSDRVTVRRGMEFVEDLELTMEADGTISTKMLGCLGPREWNATLGGLSNGRLRRLERYQQFKLNAKKYFKQSKPESCERTSQELERVRNEAEMRDFQNAGKPANIDEMVAMVDQGK